MKGFLFTHFVAEKFTRFAFGLDHHIADNDCEAGYETGSYIFVMYHKYCCRQYEGNLLYLVFVARLHPDRKRGSHLRVDCQKSPVGWILPPPGHHTCNYLRESLAEFSVRVGRRSGPSEHIGMAWSMERVFRPPVFSDPF